MASVQESKKNIDIDGGWKDSFIKNLLTPKALSLIFFVFYGTFSVCMLRFVRFRDVPVMYTAASALFIGEIVKGTFSIYFLILQTKSLTATAQTLYTETFINYTECIKSTIPALCYVLQNLLYYYAISYLDATLLLVTEQIRILTTACFATTILHKKLSNIQWMSMVVLIIGIIFMQWQASEGAAKSEEVTNGTDVVTTTHYYPIPNPLKISPTIIGLIMVLIGSVLSGFTGIYLEKMYKDNLMSVWVRNLHLAMFSIPMLVVAALITDFKQIMAGGFFNGFDYWVLTVSVVFGIHGILIALILKYASTILKCFATGFVIALTTIVSIFLFDKHISYLFVIGTCIVLSSVFLYSNFPYIQPKQKGENISGV
uniref:UDP-galactose transporter n=1 Tax=Rhabditophanes sp. KR3021 TaxID=114890 RepID=A0AC35TGB6_9BILA